MTTEQQTVFDLLGEFEIAIVGGSVKNPDAKDIDIIFLHHDEFERACRKYDVRWAGWDANYGHVRRANLNLGVSRPIQFVQVSSVTTFEDHPHILLKRDGTIMNEDKEYVKPADGKYDKGIKVDRRKEGAGKWVAIDFDGTIRDWDTSKPFPGVRDAINILREGGVRVMIHSCNGSEWIERWMNDHDIRFDSIWQGQGKPVASLYIDDRGFHFKGNWQTEIYDVMERLADVAKDKVAVPPVLEVGRGGDD